MKRVNLLFAFSFFVCLPAIIPSLYAQSLEDISFDVSEVKTNLEYLASDELQGRLTASDGERMAAEFIANKFKQYGVLPFGDNGTYFESFDVVSWKYLPGSVIKIDSEDGVKTFVYGDNFIIDPRRYTGAGKTKRKLEIVFAGFGITAPEYSYDDYKGIDVTGKTVLVFDDEPLSKDENYFAGAVLTKYASWTSKYRIAKEKGAEGVIIIGTPETMAGWDWLSKWSLSEDMKLVEETGEEGFTVATVTPETGAELLNGEKYTMPRMQKMMEEYESIPVFEMDKSVEYDIVIKSERKTARNIIGLVKGTDESLANEYVTMGGHYDHEGVKNGEVYNGADDNASGTVTVMELGRVITERKENKRPVLLLLYSGEEKGLLGSKYMANNAPFVKDMVMNINMDMVGRESIDTIFTIGSGRLSTELYNIVQQVNRETVNFVLDYKFDDPNDPNRFYERSDHYNFAKKGIPIVFFYDYMKEDYHKPGDDVEKINYDKIMKITELCYGIAIEVSNLDHKLTVDKPLEN